MKPIKKEDMPKLILLIVLAVGIFGFAVVQMISLSAPSAAAAPAATPGTATVVASASGTTPLQDPSAGDTPLHPELDYLRIGPPTGGKDPFAPNGSAAPVVPASTPTPAAPVVQPLPSPVPSGAKPSNLETLLGMNRVRPNATNLDDIEGPKAENPAPVVVELPAPAWGVSGIVLAESDSDGVKRGRDVAILRDNAGNRRFVTVGDPVDNGYHVSAVRPAGVEIRSKNRVAMIRLDSSTSTSNSSQRPGVSTGSRN